MTVQGLGDDVLSSIVLDGKKFDAHLERNLTADGPLVRSIDQPSSLSLAVDDPERYLLQGGYFGRRADLEIDDLWFRMVSLDKASDVFTLGFEDREIALLARHKKPRRASRADVTRAEFLRSLVREEPHIVFSCPELHRRQKIAGFTGQDAQQLRDGRRDRGIATQSTLMMNGKAATPSQIAMANRVLAVAQSKGAGHLASIALIEACIDEAVPPFSNTKGGDSTSSGLLQLLASTAQGLGVDPNNPEQVVAAFLDVGFTGAGGAITLARQHPDWKASRIAQAVQGSATADGSNYERFAAEAKAIYDAHGGITSTQDSNTGGGAYVQRYEYTRGAPGGPKDEDTWSCGQRLADEVAWRWFCVAGVVYFISNYDLIRSRPRMVLNERSRGVDTIDFSLDDGARIPDTATITGHAARWQAPPGTVVVLDESMGDAAGAWVVTQIERQSLTNSAVTITLGKPKAPHLEPASSVAQRAIDASATADGGVNAGPVTLNAQGGISMDSSVGKAYAKAINIANQQMPYVWGGGHSSFAPSRGLSGPSLGYDCSGAVSAVLDAGGILGSSVPLATGGLLAWGQPGKGKYLTVWVNAEHTFMEFDLPGGAPKFFEAHHTGTIVGFEGARDTTGFNPRHWPGT